MPWLFHTFLYAFSLKVEAWSCFWMMGKLVAGSCESRDEAVTYNSILCSHLSLKPCFQQDLLPACSSWLGDCVGNGN